MFNEAKAEPIWLGFRIELRRNSSYYPFPKKATPLQREQLFGVLSDIVYQSNSFQSPLKLEFEALSPQERSFIYEHYYLEQNEETAGLGAIVDTEGTKACIINNTDHVQLVSITNLLQFHSDWNQMLLLEKNIGEHLPFAFSQQFGFLTAQLPACGTGLSLVSYLHVPLIFRNDEVQKQLFEKELPKDLSISLTDENSCSHILCVETKHAMGFSEDQMITSLMTFCSKIKAEEERLRSLFQTNELDALQDTLGRAYGLLKHSHKLDPNEARQALSSIKLGLNLGLISGITDEQINTLIFTVRRAHLSLNHPTSSSDIDKARAEYLHKSINSISLNF